MQLIQIPSLKAESGFTVLHLAKLLNSTLTILLFYDTVPLSSLPTTTFRRKHEHMKQYFTGYQDGGRGICSCGRIGHHNACLRPAHLGVELVRGPYRPVRLQLGAENVLGLFPYFWG